MKPKIVTVPPKKHVIYESPGFEKKDLATHHMELLALCQFGCSYCSSNNGNYLRINRGKFAELAKAQIGEEVTPSSDPSLTMVYPDVIGQLDEQLRAKYSAWGEGRTLIVSQLTDAFSPMLVKDGTTRRALDLVLERTSFRIRILTKNAIVGSEEWTSYFAAHPGRFAVGLSIGTIDNDWLMRVEKGTSFASARLAAHRALQDAGVPTFGMLCPVFPSEVKHLPALLSALRPERCETVWAEPYNDRDNWRAVRDVYPEQSFWYKWMTDVFMSGDRNQWSDYALELYERILRSAERDGWTDKLRYLLYESNIAYHMVGRLGDARGILFQSPKGPDGLSLHKEIRARQEQGIIPHAHGETKK